MDKRRHTMVAFTVAAMATLVIATKAVNAADLYWDGPTPTADGASQGGTATWDNLTTANWDNGASVQWNNAANDTALFGGTAGTVTLGNDITLAGMEFSTGGYIINGGGNTITLGNNGGIRSTNTPGPSLWTATGTTTINADIDTNGFRFTTVGGGAANLTGAISGSGGFATYNNSNVTLSGANTYTGKTSVTSDTTGGSTLRVSSFNSVNGGAPLLASSSLGAPTTVANGTIDLSNSGKRASCTLIYEGAAATGETTDRVIDINFNDSSSQTLNASGSGLLKFTSAMTSNAAGQTGAFIIRGTGSGEIVQDLPALATGGLRELDAGTWTIAGGSVNQTRVEGGTLIVNGSLTTTTTVTVNSGATLAGTGAIGGATTVSGTVSPGASPGTLTFSDDLTLNNGSTYEFEAGDQTVVDGALTLNDNWTLALGSGLQDGGSVTIFTFGSLTGGADLAPTIDTSNLGFTPGGPLSLTSTSSAIVLNGVSVVPEPTAFVLAILGFLGLIGLGRRRKR